MEEMFDSKIVAHPALHHPTYAKSLPARDDVFRSGASYFSYENEYHTHHLPRMQTRKTP